MKQWLTASLITVLLAGSSVASAAEPPSSTSDVKPDRVKGPTLPPSFAHMKDPVVNVPGAVRGVSYKSLTQGAPVTTRALFGNDKRPNGGDVRQGHAGDCYLDATTAAYAKFHPHVIAGVFAKKSGELRRSPEGAPAARYFVRDQDTNRFKAGRPAIYDGRAPVRQDGRLPFNKEVHHSIWSPMVEYTFTKFRDGEGGAVHSDNANHDRTGFNRTANGGYPNHVMEALTGKPAKAYEVRPHNADKIWKVLTEAQSKNQVVVAGSTTKMDLRHRVHDEVADGHLDADPKTIKFDEDKWVDGHAYSAWGDKDHPFVFERNGERMIRLRNPWGMNAAGGKGNDGVSEVPFKDFVLRYDRVYIGASTAQGG